MKPSPRLVHKRGRKRKARATTAAQAQPPATTITSLGDDVLSEILVRLPSPSLLGRAALACPRWRSPTTSGDFVRRFRALHPSSPQLLGCFLSFASDGHPAFHCTSNVFDDDDDSDLAAVIRGGDFFLTGLRQSRDWFLKDSRGGLLLIASDSELTVFDPMSRRRICFAAPTYGLLADDSDCDCDCESESDCDCKDRYCHYSEYDPEFSVVCLLPSYGGSVDGGASFRVVSLEYSWRDRVRAHEYNSSTGKWRSHPWAPRSIEAPPLWNSGYTLNFSPPMHAAGRIYWKWETVGNRNVLLSLDTESMQFSHVALPPLPSSSHKLESYVLGETEDGACCLVRVVRKRTLQLWLRNEEVGSWERQRLDENRLVCLCSDIDDVVYNVAAVSSGIVLLHSGNCYSAYRFIKSKPPSGVTFLESVAVFYGSFGRWVYPYLMEWPFPAFYNKLLKNQDGEAVSGSQRRT